MSTGQQAEQDYPQSTALHSIDCSFSEAESRIRSHARQIASLLKTDNFRHVFQMSDRNTCALEVPFRRSPVYYAIIQIRIRIRPKCSFDGFGDNPASDVTKSASILLLLRLYQNIVPQRRSPTETELVEQNPRVSFRRQFPASA